MEFSTIHIALMKKPSFIPRVILLCHLYGYLYEMKHHYILPDFSKFHLLYAFQRRRTWFMLL